MAKLKLYPQSGTIEDARSLKFELSEVKTIQPHISIEDATHGVAVDITSLTCDVNETFKGTMNLNIPEHSSQSAISIFAHIEEEQPDGSYSTVQICPVVFTIKKETKDINEKVVVVPSFVGPDDLCSVQISSEPNTIVPFSINDKIFKVNINSSGSGTIHFNGKDVIDKENIDSVQ